MKICKTNILFEQSKQSLSGEITADVPLALDRSGIVAEADADILLKLDDNGELVILKNSAKSVVLERNGRRLSLASRPIRICEKDIIHIEDARLDIVRSTFMMSRPSRKFGTASRVLAASAALCSLALTACEENCNNGQTKCDGNAIYECKDNSWTLKEKCEGELDPECRVYDNQAECVPTRTSGVAMPPEECENGEYKCEDNAAYVCEDSMWSKLNNCNDIPGASCKMLDNKAQCILLEVSGEPKYECEAGSYKCEDNIVVVCDDGQWVKNEDCNDIPGASCEMLDNKAQCIHPITGGVPPMQECKEGESKCEDNVAIVCEDGKWNIEDCSAYPDSVCEMLDNKAQCLAVKTEGEMMPDCMYGQTKCEDNAVYVCDGGIWSLSEECKGITECVEMDNGAACVEMALSGVMPPEPIPVPEDPEPAKPE